MAGPFVRRRIEPSEAGLGWAVPGCAGEGGGWGVLGRLKPHVGPVRCFGSLGQVVV